MYSPTYSTTKLPQVIGTHVLNPQDFPSEKKISNSFLLTYGDPLNKERLSHVAPMQMQRLLHWRYPKPRKHSHLPSSHLFPSHAQPSIFRKKVDRTDECITFSVMCVMLLNIRCNSLIR
mmetsp:Transcript_31040/g.60785  ORF Transcript_31040/g.60785 Transcript_31040/m.60785 type:complete len:119 (-) Transcript_31040:125-481(-)